MHIIHHNVNDPTRLKAAVLQFLQSSYPLTASAFKSEGHIQLQGLQDDFLQKKWASLAHQQLQVGQVDSLDSRQIMDLEASIAAYKFRQTVMDQIYQPNPDIYKLSIPNERTCSESDLCSQASLLAFSSQFPFFLIAKNDILMACDLDIEAKPIIRRSLKLQSKAVAITICPTGKYSVIALADGCLEVLDFCHFQNENRLVIKALEDEPIYLACCTSSEISEASFLTVVITKEFTVQIWDVLHKKCLRTVEAPIGKNMRSCCVASTAKDSYIFFGTADGQVFQCHLKEHSGFQFGNNTASHSRAVQVIKAGFNWANIPIYTTAGRDCVIKVWEIESGKQISELRGHTDWITAVEIHPNGKLLLSASEDHTLRVWDLRSSKLINIIQLQDGVVTHGLKYDGSGEHMFSFNSGLVIWQCLEMTEVLHEVPPVSVNTQRSIEPEGPEKSSTKLAGRLVQKPDLAKLVENKTEADFSSRLKIIDISDSSDEDEIKEIFIDEKSSTMNLSIASSLKRDSEAEDLLTSPTRPTCSLLTTPPKRTPRNSFSAGPSSAVIWPNPPAGSAVIKTKANHPDTQIADRTTKSQKPSPNGVIQGDCGMIRPSLREPASGSRSCASMSMRLSDPKTRQNSTARIDSSESAGVSVPNRRRLSLDTDTLKSLSVSRPAACTKVFAKPSSTSVGLRSEVFAKPSSTSVGLRSELLAGRTIEVETPRMMTQKRLTSTASETMEDTGTRLSSQEPVFAKSVTNVMVPKKVTQLAKQSLLASRSKLPSFAAPLTPMPAKAVAPRHHLAKTPIKAVEPKSVSSRTAARTSTGGFKASIRRKTPPVSESRKNDLLRMTLAETTRKE